MFKTIAEATEAVGGLSEPSKMPSFGWSISALRCSTGMKLRKIANSVCSICYALKGRYIFKVVREAHERRYQKWKTNRKVWREAMTHLMHHQKHLLDNGKVFLKDEDAPVFRWFDAGDLQGKEMLDDINQIAFASPHVTFWLPTKEYNVVSIYKRTHAIAPNLCIRVSAPFKNSNSILDRHENTSSAYDDLWEVEGEEGTFVKEKRKGDDEEEKLRRVRVCVAPWQGGQCLSCRDCWDKTVKEVVYPAH